MTAHRAPHWHPPDLTPEKATALVADTVLRAAPNWIWRISFLVSFLLSLVFVAALVWSFAIGPGLWGNNTSSVWGFPIANYVFWLGVGHAGTLISSLLSLTGQRWRPAVNRFAETMTLVAVSIAGMFPIVHLGRPMYVFWVTPIPMHEGLWPQWMSALVWDFFAVLAYLLFSALYFYLGLIPDVATLRDRARHRWVAQFYGALALGWQGSSRQWRLHAKLHRLMSGVAVPLVVSVHSIVGLDFAASVVSEWNSSLYPPYFVVGALFSGFATVALIGAWLRTTLKLEALITSAHFTAIARVLLAASVVMGLSYASEWLAAFYARDADTLRQLRHAAFGDQGGWYWFMLACNVGAPQLFWFRWARTHIFVVLIIAAIVDVGMWFERYLIVIGALRHDYLESSWRTFTPTLVDMMLLLGSVGFFCFAVMAIARVLPIISMHGMRKLLASGERE